MYFVYIITNHTNTTLYVGVTDNLQRRIFEHKNKAVDGFTKQYNLYKLVYVEQFPYSNNAIAREKQIKSWRRDKKVALIQSINPQWKNLLSE